MERVAGLVLAGGRSVRFGREKATAVFRGRPLIAWVADALFAECEQVAVSARLDSAAAAWAQANGLTVLPDAEGGALAAGPLAGVLAGLGWARTMGAAWLATSPCDAPNLPEGLYRRLLDRTGPGGAAACTVQGLHPLCAVWPASAREGLAALDRHPPVRQVLRSLGAAEVAFDDEAAFANLNTPDALLAAERNVR